jgi:hypothetical protein
MKRPWKETLLTVPGLGVSLLPKLACPLCWPAYAGLLSSVGLGFLVSTKYLLPVTTAFLAIAVGALAFRAMSRHGYGPFILGALAAVGVLMGKFYWESSPTIYVAVAVLIVASVWNAWPHRVTPAVTCCVEKSS